MKRKPIVIFGLPRSGTTWLAKTLAEAEGVQYVVEPDNEGTNFLGYFYKRGLERFPYFRVGEESSNYSKLFERALFGDYITYESGVNNLLYKSNFISLSLVKKRFLKKGKNRKAVFNWDWILPKNVTPKKEEIRLVKTVHATLNIPFLMHQFDFEPLIIFRHPAAIIASQLKLKLTDSDQDVFKNIKLREDFLQPFLKKMDTEKTPLERMGMQVGIFHFVISKFIKQYNYNFILHEDLCENPIAEFQQLFKNFNLKWETKIENFIDSNNKSGEGFDYQRISKNEKDKWKKDWSKEQLEEIKRGYSIFPNELYEI